MANAVCRFLLILFTLVLLMLVIIRTRARLVVTANSAGALKLEVMARFVLMLWSTIILLTGEATAVQERPCLVPVSDVRSSLQPSPVPLQPQMDRLQLAVVTSRPLPSAPPCLQSPPRHLHLVPVLPQVVCREVSLSRSAMWLTLVTSRFPAIMEPQLIRTPLTTLSIRAFILILAIGLTAFAVAMDLETLFPRTAVAVQAIPRPVPVLLKSYMLLFITTMVVMVTRTTSPPPTHTRHHNLTPLFRQNPSSRTPSTVTHPVRSALRRVSSRPSPLASSLMAPPTFRPNRLRTSLQSARASPSPLAVVVQCRRVSPVLS